MKRMLTGIAVIACASGCAEPYVERNGDTAEDTKPTAAMHLPDSQGVKITNYRLKGDVQQGYFLQSPTARRSPAEIIMDAERENTYRAVVAAKRAGDLGKAQEALEAFLVQFPQDMFTLRDLAPIYVSRGLHEEALRTLQTLVNPPAGIVSTMQIDPSILVAYGEELLWAGRTAEALAAFRSAVEHGKLQAGPDLPRVNLRSDDLPSVRCVALIGAGLRLFYGSDADSESSAIDHLQRAVSISPSNEFARYYLGYVLAHPTIRRYKEALPFLKSVVRAKDPSIRASVAEKLPHVEYVARQLG